MADTTSLQDEINLLAQLREQMNQFKEALAQTSDPKAAAALAEQLNTLRATFSATLGDVKKLQNALQPAAEAGFKFGSALTELQGGTQQITGQMQAAYAQLQSLVGKLNPATAEQMQRAMDDLLAAFASAVTPLAQAAKPLLDTFNAVVTTVAGQLQPIFAQLGDLLQDLAKDAIRPALDMWAAITPIFKGLLDAVSPLLKIFAAIQSTVSTLLAGVVSLIASNITPILTVFGQLLTPLVEAFQLLSDIVAALVQPLSAGLMDVTKMLTELVVGALKPFMDLVVRFANWLRDLLGIQRPGVPNAHTFSAQQAQTSSMSDVERATREATFGSGSSQSVPQQQLSTLGSIQEILSTLLNSFTNWIGGLSRTLIDSVKAALGFFFRPLQAIIDQVNQAADTARSNPGAAGFVTGGPVGGWLGNTLGDLFGRAQPQQPTSVAAIQRWLEELSGRTPPPPPQPTSPPWWLQAQQGQMVQING